MEAVTPEKQRLLLEFAAAVVAAISDADQLPQADKMGVLLGTCAAYYDHNRPGGIEAEIRHMRALAPDLKDRAERVGEMVEAGTSVNDAIAAEYPTGKSKPN